MTREVKRRFFGTDGIRGPVGGPLLNPEFIQRVGAAVGRWRNAAPAPSREILIGRDTRESGLWLEHALAVGLASQGWRPVSLGVVPTPAVSLAVRKTGAALGVVLTASHNPAEDNGVKFFGSDGLKLSDTREWEIECELEAEAATSATIAGNMTLPFFDARSLYLEEVSRILPAGALRGWKLVVDAANGAAVETTPFLLREKGAEILALGVEPDGRNINAGVGSQHPEKLAEEVKRTGARLGIAHDGDADRLILCDETGSLVDGDEILVLLALQALRAGRLAANTLVVTVQSNLGVDAALAAAGGAVSRAPVGDRYVSERLVALGACLGGESSGHVICAEISPTGDGLVAALRVLAVMLETGRPLSELRRQLRKFPQVTADLRVRAKQELTALPTLQTALRAAESDLGSEGRILVRWSGTEPKLRFLVEGPSESRIRPLIDGLVEAARRDLDARSG